uniref:Reverse transcriptase domain-containing protein n=1 Tax=Tanacetum cinerariifolium TaxID=118510 RepID=A0A6L2N8T5_TANCI|nr:hypothetical protein [Tanacetum cinerariifolium]
MDQNVDFSGSEQTQTPQYPEIHPPSQEISDEVFQAKGDLMKSIQTFLEEFNCIPFEEKPHILLQAWFKFFAIKHAQPEDSNELFQKLLEDLKELAEYVNSPSRDRPNFFDNNEDHSVQHKEYPENSSTEIAISNSNQEKEKPPQDSDIQPEYSPSMGYEHPNTTPETGSDEIIKSGVEELVQILSENEVTSEDKKEYHSVQHKEYPENSSTEISISNSNQEKEKPPQDSDIRQLIREECCIEVCEEQKHNIENTILELVEICRQKELLCMHNNVDDLNESALNSKLLSINSERLNKEK